MGLDYSRGCVNFRDVGVALELVADAPMIACDRLLRGGKIDFVDALATIGDPGSIINLRRGPDPERLHPTCISRRPKVPRNTTRPIRMCAVGSIKLSHASAIRTFRSRCLSTALREKTGRASSWPLF